MIISYVIQIFCRKPQGLFEVFRCLFAGFFIPLRSEQNPLFVDRLIHIWGVYPQNGHADMVISTRVKWERFVLANNAPERKRSKCVYAFVRFVAAAAAAQVFCILSRARHAFRVACILAAALPHTHTHERATGDTGSVIYAL